MEQLELSAATASWTPLEEPIGAVLDRHVREHATGARPAGARRERLRGRVCAMIAALDPCLELARRCRRLAATAARDPASLDELGRAERELSRALRPVQFFSLVAQDEIAAAQERARTARDMAENLAAARSLFDVVERSARLLREPLAAALSDLEG